MRLLLDTVVLSELARPEPHPGVVELVQGAEPEGLYLSVLSLGELGRGIARLPDSQRRRALERWLQRELIPWFEGRILPVDREVAERWGRLMAQGERQGRVIPAVDGLLAATALVHGLTLVTRNVRDFEATGVEVLNPWG